MKFSNAQKKHLMGLAHPLKPVVLIGEKGLSDAVIEEVKNALAHHELIKIRLPAIDRTERNHLAQRITDIAEASHVNNIGRILILYKKSQKPKIELPKA